MTKMVMIALSNPADPQREDEFNDWYDNTHVPQIRSSVPGVGDVRRYRASAAQMLPEPPAHRYLAVYEIEATDSGQVLAALGAGIQGGAIELSSVLDMAENPPVTLIYEAL